MFSRSACFLAFLALCATTVPAREPRQIPEREGKFVGSIGCKSSSCHGGAGPKRDQFITWTQKDFHARAYAILTNARSARIVETIGGAPAPNNARCTVCHSPFQSVAPSRLLASAHTDEGVSCESCHGMAESWLRGHTRTDWNYATRVNAGMHDLRNLYVRANACVACHQNVDSAILKVGHPELVFELDSQSVNEPKHWRDEDQWHGPRAWLTGQAVALREMSWALSQNPPRPNEERLAEWISLSGLISKIPLGNYLPGDRSRLGEPGAFAAVQGRADEIARRAAESTWTEQSVRDLLVTLASTDSGLSDRNVALRLFLALDRLAAALNQNHAASSKIDNELKTLREDVQSRSNFDPGRFAGHLQNFRAALTR